MNDLEVARQSLEQVERHQPNTDFGREQKAVNIRQLSEYIAVCEAAA